MHVGTFNVRFAHHEKIGRTGRARGRPTGRAECAGQRNIHPSAEDGSCQRSCETATLPHDLTPLFSFHFAIHRLSHSSVWPTVCCISNDSSPHLRRNCPLAYGHFLDILTFSRKSEISDKTRTPTPIWRRCLVMRQRPRMDASGRSSSMLCDLTWHAVGGCVSCIGPSNEAVASDSVCPSGLVRGMGVYAFDP